jgi:uncharacterized protein YqeY
MIKSEIDIDLKAAMLAGDKRLVEVLRGLKSAILYKEVADGKRDTGLDEEVVVTVLKKEQRQRRDAIEIYLKAGEKSRADEENYKIDVINKYLPEEMSKEDTEATIAEITKKLGIEKIESKDLGRLIGEVKKAAPTVDGSLVAQILKSKME